MRRTTLGNLLQEQARRLGPREFIHFINTGERLSYQAFNRRCNQLAHGLARLGVSHGDFVAIMLRNSIEFLVASYALKKLGAVEVSLNVDFRGQTLVRTVNLTASPILKTTDEFLSPLGDVADQLVHLETLVVADDTEQPLPGLRNLGFAELLAGIR